MCICPNVWLAGYIVESIDAGWMDDSTDGLLDGWIDESVGGLQDG